MEEQIKITVEKHPDGYVAHARCLGGVVLGQGDTREEALADVQSAIEFHKREFGEKATRAPENQGIDSSSRLHSVRDCKR